MLVWLACGGATTKPTTPVIPTPGQPTGTTSASSFPQFQHVAIVVLENQEYSDVVGSASMPYLNSLMAQGSLATNYFANTHPSLPNYFMLTVGDTVALTDFFTGTVSEDNVVRRLVAAGASWRSYLQSLPSVGYLGGDTGAYVKHHDPFSYLSDVVNSPAQAANLVPLSALSSDLAAGQLPRYAFIVPDDEHNSHNCPTGMTTCTNADKLAAADGFLHDTIGPLLANSAFQSSGLLIVVFDEALLTDFTNGGGHVALVLAGTGVKAGFQSTTFYQHQSTLRLMLEVLGVTSYPGAAASAPEMREFFP
ncbi:MAG: alkaline phosphatase family protein [Terriglobales bacterium]